MAAKKKNSKKRSWLAGHRPAERAAAHYEPGVVAHATEKSFGDLVLKAPEPVIVDFWADWCSPCKQIAPIIEELAKEHAGRARLVKVDVEKNQKLAERYEVRSIPTLLVFMGGEIVQTFIGATSKGELTKVINWAKGGP